MSCIKVMFYFVNILFTLSAILLTAGGIWFSLQLKDITDLRNYETIQLDNTIHWPQVIPWVFAAVGVFVILTNCCGFFGGSNRGSLIVYCVFLVMTILLLLGVGFAATAVAQTENEQFIKKTVWDLFREAQERRHVAKKFGELENYLHCCGAQSFKNYLDSRKRIPESCCNLNDTVCLQSTGYNARHGCIQAATYYVYWAFVYGTSVCGVTAFLGIISLLLSVVLSIQMKNSKMIS